MTSASSQWSFDDLKPQINLTTDHLSDNALPVPGDNHYRDIAQANTSSSTVKLQTLDGILHWLINR